MKNPAKRRGSGRRGSKKSASSNELPTNSTPPESTASPLVAGQRMMALALAKVLGGEVPPDDPNFNPEHRRIFYRSGDNESKH